MHWRYDWHADKYAPNPQGGFDTIVVAAVPLASTASKMPHDSALACQTRADVTGQALSSSMKEHSHAVAQE
jgi:hypothetical protein